MSEATRERKPSAVVGFGSPPIFFRRSMVSGSFKIATASALSFAMVGCGMPAGPASPSHDVTIVRDGVTMLVDAVSLEYLAGSEIDFVDDLIGASFKVNNPKAKASCGCGTSFSL